MSKVLPLLIAAFWSVSVFSQNVFNPADPTVRYDKTKALGSSQNPNPAKLGLQKWVSTATSGVSNGSTAWDASSFKAYFLNIAGSRIAFRIKFPKTYASAPAGKKFPVMIFFHGAGEAACANNGGVYNNEKQLILGGKTFMQRVDNAQFDGFLVYPQLVAASDCWGIWGGTTSANLNVVISMVDSLSKYVKADLDRVMIDGLSGGGGACFRMAENYPKNVAKIIPSAAVGPTVGRDKFKHIPVWFATGGKDPDPSPAQAATAYNNMKNLGMDVRQTLYPDLGHGVWNRHWGEPDFVAQMNDIHKANPLVYFQKTEYCAGQAISAKLGITPGYFAYEWEKDGVVIARRTNTTNQIVNGASIISFTGNEITVRSFGTYRVRFRRTGGPEWSEWSPKPVVIKAKVVDPAPAIVVNGTKSKVLTALDGSATVPLMMPAGFINYQWQRASDNVIVSTSQTYNAPIGTYRAKYDETPGCGPSFSPDFVVVDANGSPKPDAATNPASSMLNSTSARINWSDGSNETGFEIYRTTTPGGPYSLVAITPANATSYTDNGLPTNTTFYYIVRAVNETGAAPASAETSPNGGNVAPVIAIPADVVAQTDQSTNFNFGVSDAPGDVITVTIPKKPSFITLQKINDESYNIIANPNIDQVGWNYVVVRATDQQGMYSEKTLAILVSDKNTRSVYINLGAVGKTAPAPWNNWLGVRTAGNTISNLLDENNNVTPFTVTTQQSWQGTSNMGHITGSNTGVVPDAVLASSLTDNGAAKNILIGGLDPAKRYNVVFVGSQNEGITAPSTYSSSGQSSVLNARYNMDQTANLNNLVPNASGQLTVTVARNTGTAIGYLNALIIEEFDNGAFLNPDNLYVEPVDRTSVNLTWSDKTSNETGFELVRARDSLFTTSVTTISLAANVTSYKNTGLTANTKYWYRVRARNGGASSAYSNRAATITPNSIIYVDFNTAVPDGPSPWNSLAASSENEFTTNNLRNQSGTSTNVKLALTQTFNGEFNAGVNTGNNSGIAPDNTLMGNYWLDNGQQSQFRITGLNTTRRYRIGFFGSSSLNGWFKGDYTAKYTIDGRSVYLNSWLNSTKIVYIGDVVPNASGQIDLNFSTNEVGVWGFNAGVLIEDYTDNQGGSVMTSVLDSITEQTNRSVSVYPNPFSGQFRINFENTTPTSMVSAEIYDLSGRLLVRKNYNQLPAGINVLTLNAPGNGRNVYFLALKVDGKVIHTGKLIQDR